MRFVRMTRADSGQVIHVNLYHISSMSESELGIFIQFQNGDGFTVNEHVCRIFDLFNGRS